MMRGFVADPAGLLAAWRATDKDPARPMAEARSFGTTKKEVLASADWLRCLQVAAAGAATAGPGLWPDRRPGRYRSI